MKMKNRTKKMITFALVISVLVTSIPTIWSKVSAASKTLDIAYENGTWTEGGENSDKTLQNYFAVKQIATAYGDDGITQQGTEISQSGQATINDKTKKIQLSRSVWTSKTAGQTSYIMEYKNTESRKILSYEVDTGSRLDWIGRPDGLILPFYFDSNLQGYFGLIFTTRSSNTMLQYTYGFVGQNREFSKNSQGEASITDVAGDSRMRIHVEYVYTADDTTIEKIRFSVYEVKADGSTSVVMNQISFGVAEVFTHPYGFLGNAGQNGTSGNLTADNCPKSFSAFGATAGVISGTTENRAEIAGIQVSVQKSDKEYEDEIAAEAAGTLPRLYDNFLKNKGFATADAYLKVYNQLTDSLKADCETQIAGINEYLKNELTADETFTMSKSKFVPYPALLEYTWKTEGIEATENTRTNDAVFSAQDVRTAIVTYEKSKLNGNTNMYFFTDLKQESDAGTEMNDRFGVRFSNVAVTFYKGENTTETETLNLPLVSASNDNLKANNPANIVYKSQNGYGKDAWANNLRDNSKKTPLSYSDYVKACELPYMAVEYSYKAAEMSDKACTRIDFTVKQWADNGDGVYNASDDVLLIDVDRSGDEWSYLAISWYNGAARERWFALTKEAFEAATEIVLEHSPSIKPQIADVTLGDVAKETKINLTFDFTKLLSVIEETGEQPVQYGAVLAGGVQSYSDMISNADSILKENAEVEGYTCTKKTPDEELGMAGTYYVTIANSDGVNLGKRASVIGYVIVENQTGNRTIYYTTTRASYSVMNLLKSAFTEGYLLNTDYVQNGQIVPNSLLASALSSYNAEHQAQADLESVQTAVMNGVTTEEQRNLLMTLHFALNRY